MKLAVVNISGGTISGGYRKYLMNMIPLLRESVEISDLRVYVPEKTTLETDSSIRYYQKPNRFYLGYSSIKKDLDRFKPDIIFVPTAREFSYKNVPVVNMVHNMEPLLVPFGSNPFKEKLINIMRARVAKRSTLKAKHTIAVSNHVKDFITRKWAVSTNKVVVIYLGVNSSSDMVHEPERPVKVPENTSFLFTGGSIRPARGLEDLINALPGIFEKKPDLKLVIAGKVDPGMQFYKDDVTNLAKKLGVNERIIWCGQIESNEMAWCYQNCEVFVMTSRAEACPNIVLEALTNGALSVSTDTDPMPEIFQENAIYYHKGDPVTLTDGVIRMIEKSDSEIQKIRSSAKKRASFFTWQRCADDTIQELKKVLKNS